ncbi:hypothetical protein BSPLISOX_711 [uncultured Gammaproteobacteria bacterium]|jgi:hypothetical protein|nr:hypothetical protein [uncultured Gammaproteobacteria bacterium]VVH65151.1 hypothetical protein BSPLISOX_711 [uncultured Gammaproteobacteria bacterium]
MGSMITLGIGGLELDWGKNNFYNNHSILFKSTDIKNTSYYYIGDIVEYKKGLSRKIYEIKRRLDLLGYHPKVLKNRYEKHLQELSCCPEVLLTYEEFYRVIINIDISKIEPKYLFQQSEFNKEVNLLEIFENMNPYITLRILAENPLNNEQDVYWSYSDIIEGGWAEEKEVLKNLDKGAEILIVTEGSSDTNILKKGLDMLYPDIADFFCFVDMKENYPFAGDGNLFNFCRGLTSIRIKNDILVIFDNDVAGVRQYNKARDLDTPNNMHITKLPIHKDFENFQTIGPDERSRTSNINGSAVSIECFLDHNYRTEYAPCIRWTSYNKNLKLYQGAMIKKDHYTKKFLELKKTDTEYDFSKIKYLIDYLYKEWLENTILQAHANSAG